VEDLQAAAKDLTRQVNDLLRSRQRPQEEINHATAIRDHHQNERRAAEEGLEALNARYLVLSPTGVGLRVTVTEPERRERQTLENRIAAARRFLPQAEQGVASAKKALEPVEANLASAQRLLAAAQARLAEVASAPIRTGSPPSAPPIAASVKAPTPAQSRPAPSAPAAPAAPTTPPVATAGLSAEKAVVLQGRPFASEAARQKVLNDLRKGGPTLTMTLEPVPLQPSASTPPDLKPQFGDSGHDFDEPVLRARDAFQAGDLGTAQRELVAGLRAFAEANPEAPDVKPEEDLYRFNQHPLALRLVRELQAQGVSDSVLDAYANLLNHSPYQNDHHLLRDALRAADAIAKATTREELGAALTTHHIVEAGWERTRDQKRPLDALETLELHAEGPHAPVIGAAQARLGEFNRQMHGEARNVLARLEQFHEDARAAAGQANWQSVTAIAQDAVSYVRAIRSPEVREMARDLADLFRLIRNSPPAGVEPSTPAWSLPRALFALGPGEWEALPDQFEEQLEVLKEARRGLAERSPSEPLPVKALGKAQMVDYEALAAAGRSAPTTPPATPKPSTPPTAPSPQANAPQPAANVSGLSAVATSTLAATPPGGTAGTKMTTWSGRLKRVDPELSRLLGSDARVVVDAGMGVSMARVSTPTMELADFLAQSHPNVRVIGLDLNIPAMAVRPSGIPAHSDFHSFPTYVFDTHGTLVAANVVPHSYTGDQLQQRWPETYRQALALRDRLVQEGGGRSVTDAEGNALVVSPLADPFFQRPNLSYLQGDIRQPPIADGTVDLIRDFNLTALYYDQNPVQRAAIQGAQAHLLAEGGHLLVGLTSMLSATEEYAVYQKVEGRLVPQAFVFSVDPVRIDNPGAMSGVTPSFFKEAGAGEQLYQAYVETFAELLRPIEAEDKIAALQQRMTQQDISQRIADGLNARGYQASFVRDVEGQVIGIRVRYQGDGLQAAAVVGASPGPVAAANVGQIGPGSHAAVPPAPAAPAAPTTASPAFTDESVGSLLQQANRAMEHRDWNALFAAATSLHPIARESSTDTSKLPELTQANVRLFLDRFDAFDTNQPDLQQARRRGHDVNAAIYEAFVNVQGALTDGNLARAQQSLTTLATTHNNRLGPSERTELARLQSELTTRRLPPSTLPAPPATPPTRTGPASGNVGLYTPRTTGIPLDHMTLGPHRPPGGDVARQVAAAIAGQQTFVSTPERPYPSYGRYSEQAEDVAAVLAKPEAKPAAWVTLSHYDRLGQALLEEARGRGFAVVARHSGEVSGDYIVARTSQHAKQLDELASLKLELDRLDTPADEPNRLPRYERAGVLLGLGSDQFARLRETLTPPQLYDYLRSAIEGRLDVLLGYDPDGIRSVLQQRYLTVAPPEVYRGAQPSAPQPSMVTQRSGIGTLLGLSVVALSLAGLADATFAGEFVAQAAHAMAGPALPSAEFGMRSAEVASSLQPPASSLTGLGFGGGFEVGGMAPLAVGMLSGIAAIFLMIRHHRRTRRVDITSLRMGDEVAIHPKQIATIAKDLSFRIKREGKEDAAFTFLSGDQFPEKPERHQQVLIQPPGTGDQWFIHNQDKTPITIRYALNVNLHQQEQLATTAERGKSAEVKALEAKVREHRTEIRTRVIKEGQRGTTKLTLIIWGVLALTAVQLMRAPVQAAAQTQAGRPTPAAVTQGAPRAPPVRTTPAQTPAHPVPSGPNRDGDFLRFFTLRRALETNQRPYHAFFGTNTANALRVLGAIAAGESQARSITQVDGRNGRAEGPWQEERTTRREMAERAEEAGLTAKLPPASTQLQRDMNDAVVLLHFRLLDSQGALTIPTTTDLLTFIEEAYQVYLRTWRPNPAKQSPESFKAWMRLSFAQPNEWTDMERVVRHLVTVGELLSGVIDDAKGKQWGAAVAGVRAARESLIEWHGLLGSLSTPSVRHDATLRKLGADVQARLKDFEQQISQRRVPRFQDSPRSKGGQAPAPHVTPQPKPRADAGVLGPAGSPLPQALRRTAPLAELGLGGLGALGVGGGLLLAMSVVGGPSKEKRDLLGMLLVCLQAGSEVRVTSADSKTVRVIGRVDAATEIISFRSSDEQMEVRVLETLWADRLVTISGEVFNRLLRLEAAPPEPPQAAGPEKPVRRGGARSAGPPSWPVVGLVVLLGGGSLMRALAGQPGQPLGWPSDNPLLIGLGVRCVMDAPKCQGHEQELLPCFQNDALARECLHRKVRG